MSISCDCHLDPGPFSAAGAGAALAIAVERAPEPPRQRTEAQREASRRNGARSRGPVTAEGRRRSAMNAIRHGLSGTNVVLPGPETEEREAILASYRLKFAPNDPFEDEFLRQMATAKIGELRCQRFAASLIEIAAFENDAGFEKKLTIQSGLSARHAMGFAIEVDRSEALEYIRRYLDMHIRHWHRAWKALQSEQARRQAAGPDEGPKKPNEPEPAPQPDPTPVPDQGRTTDAPGDVGSSGRVDRPLVQNPDRDGVARTPRVSAGSFRTPAVREGRTPSSYDRPSDASPRCCRNAARGSRADEIPALWTANRKDSDPIVPSTPAITRVLRDCFGHSSVSRLAPVKTAAARHSAPDTPVFSGRAMRSSA